MPFSHMKVSIAAIVIKLASQEIVEEIMVSPVLVIVTAAHISLGISKTQQLLIIGSEFSTINTNQGETLAQKKSWQYSN